MSIRKKVVWLPYDMDTAIGINNSGLLVFSYNLEDTDLQQGGEFVFNGQDSVMWTNLRDAFGDDIKAMYQQLRSSGAISYDRIEQMFETHQAKWSEAIFNEDAFYKYIEPLTNPDAGKQPDASYLPMAQGSKAEQRKWWLFNRFRYMDSKFNAGDALTDYIMMRAYAVDDQVLTPYADIYLTTSWDGELTQVRATRGQTYTLACPKDTANDAVVAIYSASQLSSIGDLSGLKIKSGNFSMATRLTSLKVGDSNPNYSNTNLTDLQLGSNTLLSTLDVRNCPNLVQTIDIRGCTNIEEAYFEGTSIAAAQLPNGGVLRVLHLPGTVKNLTIQNQPSLINFSIEGEDYSEITTLWLENAGVLGGMARTMLNDIADGSNVRLINVYWECADASEIETVLSRLDKMHGIDETGLPVSTAQVSGEIHTDSLTGAQIASFNARYPYIRVTADHTSSFIYFYNGSTLITQKTVLDGGDATYSGSTPTKAQDAQYTYSFSGWSKDFDDNTVDSDALTAVTADRNVYACFTSTIRTYTVTWVNNGTTIETDTNVPYGTIPHYDGATPTKDGQTSTGWLPDPTVPITGDTTFTAQYLPIYRVRFYNDTMLLQTKNVLQGSSAVYDATVPVDPSGKGLEFLGWATSNGAHTANAVLTNVQSNMDVYAAFKVDVTNAYGVEWTYTNSSPILTRVGLATSFADPTPATSIGESGSSPFDNIAPWKDMKRYNVINGEISYSQDNASFDETSNDTVVYIPEFYYAVEKDTTNGRWTWSISPTAKTGYAKHPGSGRYVGRFHTGGDSMEVFTKGGIAPLTRTTQDNFRTYSHNKGSNWYMMDLASWSAIQMLYLIEFATFNSQDALGKGWSTGSVGTMGGTTGAAYHTIKTSGAHNQYRWIEDPFSNVLDNIDGFIALSRAVYAGVSDTGYTGSTSDLTNTGITLPLPGTIQGFGYSVDTPWAFIPDTVSETDYTTYVTDRIASNTNTDSCVARVGGYCNGNDMYGFFFVYAYYGASYNAASYGSRLLYIP